MLTSHAAQLAQCWAQCHSPSQDLKRCWPLSDVSVLLHPYLNNCYVRPSSLGRICRQQRCKRGVECWVCTQGRHLLQALKLGKKPANQI